MGWSIAKKLLVVEGMKRFKRELEKSNQLSPRDALDIDEIINSCLLETRADKIIIEISARRVPK